MIIKTVAKTKFFVPEFNGNKELAEKDQIVIEIKKFPTAIEVKEFKAFRYDGDGNVILAYKDSLLIDVCIGGIRNLEADGKKIKTGKDLQESTCLALDGLISEIRNYILDSGEVIEPEKSSA
jgi:hypothetical protein